MGGSQSALCFLAKALTLRGHQVTIVNGRKDPIIIEEISHLGLQNLPASLFQLPDSAFVFLNPQASHARPILQFLSDCNVVVQWQQHAFDQPAVAELTDPSFQNDWDAFVFVSEWQRQTFKSQFGIEEKRSHVIRNAIGNPFEKIFSNLDYLRAMKRASCCLAYTSTPFRGLALLVDWFAELRKDFPSITLDVFSSMTVYFQTSEYPEDETLYDRCRNSPGIRYVGSLGQYELARRLSRSSILAYPNVFHETSCIAAYEALAAGLGVVTTNLGALPETCYPYAKLADHGNGSDEIPVLKSNWLRLAGEEIEEWSSSFDAWSAKRFEQAVAVSSQSSWSQRAIEWELYLQRLLASPDHE